MSNTIDTQSTAIPFIYLQNDKFIVSQQAKLFLSQIKTPICVLTIVGKYRTGKSLFLNRIMLGKSKAFKVSPTINSCTRGLWLWKDSLKFQNQTQQKQVLIIDTQGFGATEQSDAYNNKILLFALLLSSYFVYNSVGSIDQNSLNTISVLANLANQIQSKNTKDQNIQQYFPSFLWLVRDFSLNLVDKNDFPIQPKEYLQQALEIQKGTSNLIQGKNRIRRMMKHFFIDRDCFTLVRPVQTEDNLQQLDTLQQKDFRETFLQQAKALRQKIMLKIKPKKLKNTLLTGESLFELAQNYVQVINSNSLPNFQSSYKHLMKIQMNTLRKKIAVQNQLKANKLVLQCFSRIKSTKQFYSEKQQFLLQLQKSTKQRIKAHHSLSAFANSQQVLVLINEIRQSASLVIHKCFSQRKEVMRYQYIGIIGQIKEDNMMSHSLQNIKNEKQFKQFVNVINQQLHNQIQANNVLSQCPQLILTQFQSDNFIPYINQLQQQFNTLSTKRLSQQHKQMRIKLQMKQDMLKQKQRIIDRMQNQLIRQRQSKSEVEIMHKMVQKQLGILKQDSLSKQQNLLYSIRQLQQTNLTLHNESIYLANNIQKNKQQLYQSNQLIHNYTLQLTKISKQLAITKQRLQSRTNQLSEKKDIISKLDTVIDEKNTKIETLLVKIQQLRQHKQQLYHKFIQNNKQSSIKIVNLQKANTKLSTQLKQLNKIIQKQSNNHNQSIKHIKQQLLTKDERYQQLLLQKQNLSSTNTHLMTQLESYNKKQDKYKSYKKCIKNSSSIQCQHCTRFFMSSIFLTHLTLCTSYNNSNQQEESQNNTNNNFNNNNNNNISISNSAQNKISFRVTNVLLHENNNKPFTVYQIQCTIKSNNNNNNKAWTIQKKFTQFCQLNQHLHASLPGVQLSSAKSIFDPKYLSKKSLSIQQKQFLIQRYFNDLGVNVAVSNNKYWQDFINYHQQGKANNSISHSQPVTRRTALNQLSQTEIMNCSNTNNGHTLNYHMKKSQVKEQSIKSLTNTQNNSNHNSTRNLKKQTQQQTPQQFFKIWQQKQLRSKASSMCLKKTMH